MTTIHLHELTRHYPHQTAPAIHDVSLTAEHGELLALLGPSGSGKSTILKLIAGIDSPDRGDIWFDGRSILAVAANRRGAVLMFQKAYLFPFATVADNIGFGLKVKGTRKAEIKAAVGRMLEIVELPGFERRYPSQLSGGEQQRVALARALVTNPHVLLLDEPLSSLDTAVRQTLQEVIRRVQRDMGITMLLVTHDLSEAMAMSDRIALLLHGTIAAYKRPDELFQRPPTREIAQFVGVSTFLEGHVEEGCLDTAMGSFVVTPSHGPLHSALFAIRPEHMRLLSAPAGNALLGVVVDMLYKGEFMEYCIHIAASRGGNAAPLAVRVRDYQPVRCYGCGDMVYVLFPPECLFEVRAS